MAGRFQDHENWMRFIGATHVGVAQLRSDPRAALSILGTAMIYQVSVVLTVGFVILTIGAPVPVGAVIAFVPVVAMAQVVPISLSGLGVREGMFVLLLHPLGIPNGQAIGIGLLWYLTMLLVSFLGAPAFAVGNRHPRRSEPDRNREHAHRSLARRKLHRKLWAREGPARRSRHLLVGRDPRDPALLLRVLRGPERGPDPRRSQAFHHAKQLMGWQQTLGINHELTINEWALHFKPLVVGANYFYGSLHFIVTIGVGIYLFTKWPNDYPRLAQHARDRDRDRAHRIPVLAAHAAPAARLPCPGVHYGFVDTLAKYPTLWTFNSGAMKKISNQFAAMPSVHCCWALWCACALVPRLKHLWAKLLAALLPGHDRVGDRDHGEPLLPRRGRRVHDLRHRLRPGPARHPCRARAGDRARARRRPASVIDLDHVAIATDDIGAALDTARRSSSAAPSSRVATATAFAGCRCASAEASTR